MQKTQIKFVILGSTNLWQVNDTEATSSTESKTKVCQLIMFRFLRLML
jgi:hypothetical protein